MFVGWQFSSSASPHLQWMHIFVYLKEVGEYAYVYAYVYIRAQGEVSKDMMVTMLIVIIRMIKLRLWYICT